MTEIVKDRVTGNILLFYTFDIGDDIDLAKIKAKRLVDISDIQLSPFFKYYHMPLSFRIPEERAGVEKNGGFCVYRKIYNFGVLSFCYRVPFTQSFEDLKRTTIDIKKKFDEQSIIDAQVVFNTIVQAIGEPRFYNLKNDYCAVQVAPLPGKVTAEQFRQKYGAKIASLLRLETQKLSDYQMDQILASTTGYYGQDLIIIDTDASFIYDDEYFEPLEFFESANIEKLELQYFDQLLDKKLQSFYAQESYKLPWTAYIPLLRDRIDLPVSQLAKLRVDISVITERLENSVKLTGDVYYKTLYSMLVENLQLKEWRDSINKKLNIMRDLYAVYQDRLDTIHEELLTIVIILLIALEVFMAIR